MERNPGATAVRWNLARDGQGRSLFLPWYPVSRTAFVLPGPVEREALAERMRLLAVFWLGVVIGVGLAGLFGELPAWFAFALVGGIACHWGLWSARQTRGLERTTYEPPG